MNNASSYPKDPDMWIQTEVLKPQLATTLLSSLRKKPKQTKTMTNPITQVPLETCQSPQKGMTLAHDTSLFWSGFESLWGKQRRKHPLLTEQPFIVLWFGANSCYPTQIYLAKTQPKQQIKKWSSDQRDSEWQLVCHPQRGSWIVKHLRADVKLQAIDYKNMSLEVTSWESILFSAF